MARERSTGIPSSDLIISFHDVDVELHKCKVVRFIPFGRTVLMGYWYKFGVVRDDEILILLKTQCPTFIEQL